MTEVLPPSGPHRGWLAIFCIAGGALIGVAFHDLAGLRPFMPPVLVSGASLACADLSAYVDHVADLNDHRLHEARFGIHRQSTIDAVNELYDRARCQARQDAAGHETYQKLSATAVADVNDPGPRTPVSPPTADAPPAPTTSTPKAYVTSRRHAAVYGSLPRRSVTLADDENQAGTPAGAQDSDTVPKPLHCGPDADGIDYHVTGCP